MIKPGDLVISLFGAALFAELHESSGSCVMTAPVVDCDFEGGTPAIVVANTHYTSDDRAAYLLLPHWVGWDSIAYWEST